MDDFIVDALDPVYFIRWRYGALDFNARRTRSATNTLLNLINTGLQILRASINENFYRRNNPSNAVFIIQNIDRPDISWAYNNGRPVDIQTITAEIILNGISELVQSGFRDDPVVAGRYKFGFAFEPMPRLERMRGSGKTKIPSWISMSFLPTWEVQVFF